MIQSRTELYGVVQCRTEIYGIVHCRRVVQYRVKSVQNRSVRSTVS